MVEKDPQSSRRSVLKCLGATALVMGTIGEVSHSAKAKKSISHTTLRGKVSSPIDVKEIEKEKEKFLNKLTKNRSRAFLDAEQAFNSESIIGYNLIRLKKGTVHEQFVVVNRENKNQIETNKRVNNSGTSSEVTNKTELDQTQLLKVLHQLTNGYIQKQTNFSCVELMRWSHRPRLLKHKSHLPTKSTGVAGSSLGKRTFISNSRQMILTHVQAMLNSRTELDVLLKIRGRVLEQRFEWNLDDRFAMMIEMNTVHRAFRLGGSIGDA
ncbi:hypothetical protein GL213_08845 [Halogeometricum borinquense]|uniref:Uncharacterized protein n=1 Tax=Halogeometricum borinquense TaxID=60847 RepID=A0A6C0UG46_9EURY|nr:hypothetical protein [Halogeometricum borinquense]QIB74177.1 hypothetical protein G3I44_07625 [Halogeometricum borinquense]QIQ76616.1 hypothetical protein GL213_08845 [Halogeometricum borinquense]